MEWLQSFWDYVADNEVQGFVVVLAMAGLILEAEIFIVTTQFYFGYLIFVIALLWFLWLLTAIVWILGKD